MLLRIASLLLIMALPAAASAGKVCLSDEATGFFYVFPKLKVPKKTDSPTAVTGLAYSVASVNALPLSGTLLRDQNTGKILLAFTRYFDACLVQADLTEALSGSVAYDCNFDGANDGTYTITAVPCPD